LSSDGPTLSSPSPIVSTNETSAYDPLNPTLKQARSGPDAAKWTQAIKEEEDVLFKKDTFRYVSLSEIPAEYRPIPTKFVLKIKNSGKYKARLVVCGNLDSWDGETFSPTSSRSVIWLIFALIVMLRLYVITVDITAAFVTEPITRTVYVIIRDLDGNIRYAENFSSTFTALMILQRLSTMECLLFCFLKDILKACTSPVSTISGFRLPSTSLS